MIVPAFFSVAAQWHERRRSAEALARRELRKQEAKAKSKAKRKRNKAKGKLEKRRADEVWVAIDDDGDTIFYDVEETIYVKKKHTDEHVRLVWENQFALPRGLGSFVDAWGEAAWFKPHPSKFYVVRDADTNQILYRIKAGGLFVEGVDCASEYKVIRHLPQAVKTNQAGKRYCAKGNGFVGAVGIRYRYSEPKDSGRQKLDSVAAAKVHLYVNVLQAVNRVANAIVRCAEQMGPDLQTEMQDLRTFITKVCDMPGMASFTYPIASVGVNGAYGAHKDKRDTRTTLWGSMKYGGIAWPAYEHVCELSPGDVVAFDGKAAYHANVVYPASDDELAGLPEQLLNMIIALYFQSQQESYLRNNYNAEHPEEQLENALLDAIHSHHDDSTSSELSEYELERLSRIKHNLEALACRIIDR